MPIEINETPRKSVRRYLGIGMTALVAALTGACLLGKFSGSPQVPPREDGTSELASETVNEAPETSTGKLSGMSTQCETALCPITPNVLWGLPFKEFQLNQPESLPLFKTLMDASHELQTAEFGRAKRLAQEIEQRATEPLDLNPYETAFFNFVRYLDIIEIAGPFLRLNELPPAVFKVFPHLTRDEIAALKNYLAYYQQQRLPFSAVDIQELQTRLGEEGAKQKIKDLIRDLLQRLNRIKSHPILQSIELVPASATLEIDLRRIAFRAESNRLGPADVAYLKNLFMSANLVEDLLTDADLMKTLTAKAFRKEDYLNLPQTKKIFEQLRQAEAGNKENRLWRNEERHDSNRCLTMLNRLYFATPTQNEIDEFKKDLPDHQTRFIKTLQPYLSADAFKTLEEASAKWKVIFPSSREKQIQLLKRDIQQILADAKIRHKEAFPPLTRIRIAMALLELSSTAQGQTDIGRLCFRISNDLPGDFASGNQIQLSPYTVRFKDQRGALSHELMHLALKALSESNTDSETKSWIERTKTCLRENHSEDASDKMIEEDFADLIAFTAESGDSSFICPTTNIQYLLSRDVSPFEAIERRQSPTSYYKSQGFDRGYSSPFFRLIHSHVVRKGEVPEVCRQVVAREKSEIKIRNCLAR